MEQRIHQLPELVMVLSKATDSVVWITRNRTVAWRGWFYLISKNQHKKGEHNIISLMHFIPRLNIITL